MRFDGIIQYNLNRRPQHTCRALATCSTPDALRHAAEPSPTAAALLPPRAPLGMVPSALTYRVRQLEDALDVLLFDRSSRQAQTDTRPAPNCCAKAAPACRKSTPWPTASSAWPRAGSRNSRWRWTASSTATTVMELCESFFSPDPADAASSCATKPSRARWRRSTVRPGRPGHRRRPSTPAPCGRRAAQAPAGPVQFRLRRGAPPPAGGFAIEPISDEILQSTGPWRWRTRRSAAAALDLRPAAMARTSSPWPRMQAKLDAQLRGLGGGYLPSCLMWPARRIAAAWSSKDPNAPRGQAPVHYAWRGGKSPALGGALQWWLAQLESPCNPGCAALSVRQRLKRPKCARTARCGAKRSCAKSGCRRPPGAAPPVYKPPTSTTAESTPHDTVRNTSRSWVPAWPPLPARARWCRPAHRVTVFEKSRGPAGACPPATARLARSTTARSTSPVRDCDFATALETAPGARCPGAPTRCACSTPMAA